jgi:hypothetical protein
MSNSQSAKHTAKVAADVFSVVIVRSCLHGHVTFKTRSGNAGTARPVDRFDTIAELAQELAANPAGARWTAAGPAAQLAVHLAVKKGAAQRPPRSERHACPRPRDRRRGPCRRGTTDAWKSNPSHTSNGSNVHTEASPRAERSSPLTVTWVRQK